MNVIASALGEALPFALLGALLGAGHFAALRGNVTRYLEGGSPGPALALHLGRLLLSALGFALIAPAGAVALLAALAGFLAARTMAIRPREAQR